MKKNRGSCFKSAADPMKRTFVKIQTILGPNIDPASWIIIDGSNWKKDDNCTKLIFDFDLQSELAQV